MAAAHIVSHGRGPWASSLYPPSTTSGGGPGYGGLRHLGFLMLPLYHLARLWRATRNWCDGFSGPTPRWGFFSQYARSGSGHTGQLAAQTPGRNSHPSGSGISRAWWKAVHELWSMIGCPSAKAAQHCSICSLCTVSCVSVVRVLANTLLPHVRQFTCHWVSEYRVYFRCWASLMI